MNDLCENCDDDQECYCTCAVCDEGLEECCCEEGPTQ